MRRTKRQSRWFVAIFLTFLLHGAILCAIGYKQLPEYAISVQRVSPEPRGVIELLDNQAVQVVVYFSSIPELGLNLAGAQLYRIESGERQLVSSAVRHPKASNAIQFGAVRESGFYEVVLKSSGEDALFAPPFGLDGEFLGVLPSGDGELGGDFVTSFELVDHRREVMTATMHDATKPLVNDESPAASKALERQEISPKLPPPPLPQSAPKPSPPQMQETQNASPEEIPPEPAKRFRPEFLQVQQQNYSQIFGQEIQAFADERFVSADQNRFVAEGKENARRLSRAYAKGPMIGKGDMGNAVEHLKSVSEFIAKMHEKIHKQWAYTFLIYLDTHFHGLDSPLNNTNLSAEVEITMDSFGKVVDVRFVRPTGVSLYDSEVVSVAWNSAPGDFLPKEMRSVDGKAYIHWTFWRDTRQCGVFGVKVFTLNQGKQNTLYLNQKDIELEQKKLGLYEEHVLKKPKETSSNKTPETVSPTEVKRISPLED